MAVLELPILVVDRSLLPTRALLGPALELCPSHVRHYLLVDDPKTVDRLCVCFRE